MSRKRYVTTDMSLSRKLEDLARRAGEYAVILFTWMIPHLDDWGRMEGDADKVFFAVTPRFALLGRTPDDAEKALSAMAELGLIQRYEVNGRLYIQANLDTFYELQTYIPKAKRQEDGSSFPPPPAAESQPVAQSSTEQQRVAQNTPSPFSLLPSPSPSGEQSCAPPPPTAPALFEQPQASGPKTPEEPPKGKHKAAVVKPEYPEDFERFWSFYPRHVGKFAALKCWHTQLKAGVSPEDLVSAARNYAAYCRRNSKEPEYILHASTFLGPKRRYEDFIQGPTEEATGPRIAANVRRGLELVEMFRRQDQEGGALHDPG